MTRHVAPTLDLPELANLPAVLTRSEAAAALRVSVRTLDRLIARKRLSVLDGLGRPRIARSAVIRLLTGEQL